MKPNSYDNLIVNVQKLHETPFKSTIIIPRRNPYLIGGLIRAGLWGRLVDSGFVRDWFDEFHIYWVNVWGGRPLKLHDFFYLYSDYRKRYQNVELDESRGFLESWQLPENIYSVFNAVYKYAYQPISYFPFRRHIKEANNVLEYGCGIAPITYSAIKYGAFHRKDFTIADIPTFTHHFAKWRMYNEKNVHAMDLAPYQMSDLKQGYDLIFLMTVLEHLPNPVEVLMHLHKNMSAKGVLILDFVLGEGKGLDTKQAIMDREKIVRFLEDNFILEAGRLEVNKSTGTTILRKK